MKALSSLLLSGALLMPSLFGHYTANAQKTAEVSAKLTQVSLQMQSKGDNGFVVVDALKDDLIQEGKPYDILYKDGLVRINDKLLAEPFQSSYAALLKAFLMRNNHPGQAFLRLQSNEGAFMTQILDPSSSFRNPKAPNLPPNQDYTPMLKELAKDGLVDKRFAYNLRIDKNGIYVNGKKLNGDKEAKYRDLYKSLFGFTVRDPGDSMSAVGGSWQ